MFQRFQSTLAVCAINAPGRCRDGKPAPRPSVLPLLLLHLVQGPHLFTQAHMHKRRQKDHTHAINIVSETAATASVARSRARHDTKPKQLPAVQGLACAPTPSAHASDEPPHHGLRVSTYLDAGLGLVGEANGQDCNSAHASYHVRNLPRFPLGLRVRRSRGTA